MRETRSSGSVEGVMGNHDPYSDCSLWALGQHLVTLILECENPAPKGSKALNLLLAVLEVRAAGLCGIPTPLLPLAL